MRTVHTITTFNLKPGKMDEFIRLQRGYLESVGGRIEGWKGSRMYRALDGKTAVLVSLFDSQEAIQKFGQSASFLAHREKIDQLVEGALPGRYAIAYEAGDGISEQTQGYLASPAR